MYGDSVKRWPAIIAPVRSQQGRATGGRGDAMVDHLPGRMTDHLGSGMNIVIKADRFNLALLPLSCHLTAFDDMQRVQL